MSVISVEVVILILIALVGISLHIFRPLQRLVILDFHKHLIKWSVQRHINSFLKTNLPSCCLNLSSLSSGPSLDEDLV